jgi:hypothetical protein
LIIISIPNGKIVKDKYVFNNNKIVKDKYVLEKMIDIKLLKLTLGYGRKSKY